jgi:hypothetical protein
MLTQVTRTALIAGAAGLGFAAAPSFAQSAGQAQTACGQRDAIIAQLQDKYQESHRASGLQSGTEMVEVWASEGSGSFTILVTRANGISCIALVGQNWLENGLGKVAEGTAL